MASRPRRSGNVVPFDGRIRAWRNLLISPPQQSLDPNAPVAYILEMSGMRSDEIAFTVRLALKKQAVDLLPSPFEALKLAAQAYQDLFNQLQSFRDCPCTLDTSCPGHQRQ